MPGKLLVKRKGYTTKKGARVRPTTFLIKDRGKPGRGPEVITIKREGFMTGFATRRGFLRAGGMITEMPDKKIREMAIALANEIGPRKALSMFIAQVNLRSRARGEQFANRRKFEVGKEAIQRRFFSG